MFGHRGAHNSSRWSGMMQLAVLIEVREHKRLMEACVSVRFKAHRRVYIDVTRAMRTSIEKCKKAHLSANVPHSQQSQGIVPYESTTIRLVIVRILCDLCSGWVGGAEKRTHSQSQDVSVTRTYCAS